jgi:hypothetical protein
MEIELFEDYEDKNYLIEDYPKKENVRERYKKKNKNIDKSFEYHAKHPEPNYSKFKTEFIDIKGREYRRADQTFVDRYIKEGSMISRLPYDIPLKGDDNWGKQIFWIKIPIRLRGNIGYPDKEEYLELFDIHNQIIGDGFTDGIFYGEKKKTGYVIINDFITRGQLRDPSPFLKFIDKKKKLKYEKQPLF